MPHVEVARNHGSEPVNLYYEVHGNGPQKLLLIGGKERIALEEGFGNICHQWDLQVEFFGKRPEFSVCIFDNRGAGQSSIPKGRYKTSEMAMDARDLLDFLGWEKFHLVGLSMGGMIAQELAHLCRHRLLSLTLESTYAYFNGLPMAGFRGMVAGAPKGERTVETFANHVVNSLLFPEAWLKEKAPEHTGCATNREHMVKFFKERFSASGLQNPKGRDGQQSACMTHWMTKARLEEIRAARVPVLVMTGDDDNVLIQPSSSAYLAAVLGGRLEIFEGGGHALRLQFPERHNALLLEHLLHSWRLHDQARRDALAASLAAGCHRSPSSSPAPVVWGGVPSHERGWVEEKDPGFPALAVERCIVEAVEFSEDLVLPGRKRPARRSVLVRSASVPTAPVSPLSPEIQAIRASVASATVVSSASASLFASPRTSAAVASKPVVDDEEDADAIAIVSPVPTSTGSPQPITLAGLLVAWSRSLPSLWPATTPVAAAGTSELSCDLPAPARRSSAGSPPLRPSHDASAAASGPRSGFSRLDDDAFGDDDDEVSGTGGKYGTPLGSVHGTFDQPDPLPCAPPPSSETDGEGTMANGEEAKPRWWVGSSFNFGFGDFVSMIPGTPGVGV
ncbi:hypothetical protein HDU96_007909 [Phlyctochytrium bullatum]|nr:hypothetical protein HDU96_007909 [Phlyctochytrium bullatum]